MIINIDDLLSIVDLHHVQLGYVTFVVEELVQLIEDIIVIVVHSFY